MTAKEDTIGNRSPDSSRARDADPIVLGGLIAIGLYLVSISLLMIVSPGTFYEEIGPFNERSDHYIRDGATFGMALGILALLAVRRPSWRVPTVFVLLLNFIFHALNHLADINEADPAWLGPADFLGLAAGSALLAWMLIRLR